MQLLLEGTAPGPNFDDFYRSSYAPLTRALVVALGDLDRGTEAADEAMTRAYRKWDSVGSYENPQGWCFRVGLNYGRSILRKVRRPFPSAALGAGWADDTLPNPELWRALQQLERSLRDVTVCRVLLGLSTKETATHLNISEGTVKSRFSRARTHLRKALETDE